MNFVDMMLTPDQLTKYESQISDLKKQRKDIKDNYENSMMNKKSMNVMENLLQLKLKFKQSGGGGNGLKGETHHMGNMDVLVMN